jgi:hypothetical protein
MHFLHTGAWDPDYCSSSLPRRLRRGRLWPPRIRLGRFCVRSSAFSHCWWGPMARSAPLPNSAHALWADRSCHQNLPGILAPNPLDLASWAPSNGLHPWRYKNRVVTPNPHCRWLVHPWPHWWEKKKREGSAVDDEADVMEMRLCRPRGLIFRFGSFTWSPGGSFWRRGEGRNHGAPWIARWCWCPPRVRAPPWPGTTVPKSPVRYLPLFSPYSPLRLAYLRMEFGVSGTGGRAPAMAPPHNGAPPPLSGVWEGELVVFSPGRWSIGLRPSLKKQVIPLRRWKLNPRIRSDGSSKLSSWHVLDHGFRIQGPIGHTGPCIAWI